MVQVAGVAVVVGLLISTVVGYVIAGLQMFPGILRN